MKLLAPNKIYDSINPGQSFKEWIQAQKDEYGEKLKLGKIRKETDFLTYINLKFNNKINTKMKADGLFKNIGDIFSQASVKMKEEEEASEIVTLRRPSKPILGLKPVVFYSITMMVILGSVTALAIMYRKYKKS